MRRYYVCMRSTNAKPTSKSGRSVRRFSKVTTCKWASALVSLCYQCVVRVHGKLHVVVGFGDVGSSLSSMAGSNFFLGGFRGLKSLVKLAVVLAVSSSSKGTSY